MEMKMKIEAPHFAGGGNLRCIVRTVMLAAIAAGLLGCGSGSKAKKYPLKGTITSVNVQGGYAVVDGEAIPGFMGAMKMPYVVHDANALSKLSAGDTITADIAVTNDGDALENIVITGKTSVSGADQKP